MGVGAAGLGLGLGLGLGWGLGWGLGLGAGSCMSRMRRRQSVPAHSMQKSGLHRWREVYGGLQSHFTAGGLAGGLAGSGLDGGLAGSGLAGGLAGSGLAGGLVGSGLGGGLGGSGLGGGFGGSGLGGCGCGVARCKCWDVFFKRLRARMIAAAASKSRASPRRAPAPNCSCIVLPEEIYVTRAGVVPCPRHLRGWPERAASRAGRGPRAPARRRNFRASVRTPCE
jgi:hypothetical protein